MIQQLDHVNLVVENLDRMLAFYRDTLGLTLTKQATIEGDWIDSTVGLSGVRADVVYLELPSGSTRVELIYFHHPVADRPLGVNEPNRPGVRHLAFRVDDIDAMTQRLRDAGTTTLSNVQWVPQTQVNYAGNERKRLVYFRDPEGNLLELCWYGLAD